jgi:hypothetical protein
LFDRWHQQSGRRGLTIHWGPWAPVGLHSGMVSEQLHREFQRRGAGVIDPDAGPLCLLQELAWGDPDTTAVTFTPSSWITP